MRNSLRRSLRALPACALVLSGLAITGASFFVAPSVASAAPPACTDSWKTAVSGNWDTATNWSTGAVPGSSDVACITVGGTYTVTYQPASGSETIDALVVGSGTTGDAETLLIQGTCSDNVTLTTKNTAFSPDSDAINSTGHISLTSSSCGNNSTFDIGTSLVNGGTLSIDTGAGGSRAINGSVTNQKMVNVNAPVSFGLNGSSGTWDNAGALNLATGQTFTANTTGVTFTNDTGGSVVSTGTGQLVIDAPDVYNQGNGTTSGGESVLLNGPSGSTTGIALHYTGTGASSVVAQGGDGTVDGAIASGQTLTVNGTCSNNAVETVDASETNAGAVHLSSSSCGNPSTFVVTTGDTFTNQSGGTLQVDVGAGGARTITGNVTNDGTVNVNSSTSFDPGTWDNAGALNIADSQTLTVTTSSSTFTDDTGGSVVSNGTNQTGQLVVDGGNTYNQGNGTTSGEPVLLAGPAGSTGGVALHYTGTGASTIVAQGGADTVDGAIVSGQTLTVNGTCSNNAVTTVDASETNAGTVHLSSSSCGNSSTLAVTKGDTLNNKSAGIIDIDGGAGGSRAITGNLTNQGTVNDAVNASYSAGKWDNAGQLNVANSVTLDAPASTKTTFTDDTGGSVIATGSGKLELDGGNTYNQGAGTTTGTEPVLLAGPPGSSGGVALHYTGAGSSVVTTNGAGTLDGTISSGQTLNVVGVCSNNADEVLDAKVTSTGTIAMTSAGCGNNATIAGASATGLDALTIGKGGLLESQTGAGGARTIDDDMTVKKGSFDVNTSTTYTAEKKGFSNKGTLDLASGVTLTETGVTNSAFNNSKGSITGSGELLVQSPDTFKEGKATIANTATVLVNAANVLYSPVSTPGAGTIETEGVTTLTSGTPSSGQTLDVNGTCSLNAQLVTMGSIIDNGQIGLNSSSCGNNSAVTLPAGDTLTLGSTGSLTWPSGAGGTRTVTGNVVNDGAMGNTSAVNGTTLGVTGNLTFGSTGTYAPFVNTSGGSDSVTVSGSGTLGGTLNPAGTFTASTVYTMLHGSFTGTFSATHGWVVTVNPSTVTMTHS
jgi:hypothetical protein